MDAFVLQIMVSSEWRFRAQVRRDYTSAEQLAADLAPDFLISRISPLESRRPPLRAFLIPEPLSRASSIAPRIARR